MERKTQINAEDGKQDLWITREFDLSVDLLFFAYTEAEIVEQWMGTKVLKLENRKHGSFQFETTDPQGNKYHFNGAIHDFQQDEKIVRTFEFEKSPLGVQLEVLTFEKISADKSKLTIHTIYESGAHREQQLKMPFAYGINMAHDRLQQIVQNIKR